MKKTVIPLSMASAGMEYVIEHVNEGKTGALNLRGYGIFPGSSIRPVFKSPAGDPVAYEIMGTVLALRLKDSENIYVSTPLHREEKI